MAENDATPLERLARHRATARQRRAALTGRGLEGLKATLVVPLIAALGYDPSDPFEVMPAYGREDTGRADYAVMADDAVRLLVTVVSTPDDLTTERAKLLARAVASTGADCCILTDGSEVRIHAPADAGIDPSPLFRIDVLGDADLAPLTRLSRDAYDVPTLVAEGVSHRLAEEIDEAFGRALAEPGERLASVATTLLGRTVASESLSAAAAVLHARRSPVAATPEEEERRTLDEDEQLSYRIVQAIASSLVDPSRIAVRINDTYTAILLDDNHNKTIARLHYGARRRQVGTLLARSETKHPVEGPVGIYALADHIREGVSEILSRPARQNRVEDDRGPDDQPS